MAVLRARSATRGVAREDDHHLVLSEYLSIKLNRNEWTDPKGIEVFLRPKLLKTSVEGLARLVQDTCLRKWETAAKPTVTRILVQTFPNKPFRIVEGGDVAWHASTAVDGGLSHPVRGRTGPAFVVSVDTSVATNHRSDADNLDENWLAGRLTGVMSLVVEEAGKERKAVVGTTDESQKVCSFYARKQGVMGNEQWRGYEASRRRRANAVSKGRSYWKDGAGGKWYAVHHNTYGR